MRLIASAAWIWCLLVTASTALADEVGWQRVKIDDTFVKFPEAAPLRKALTGYFWIKRAWEARGGGYAHQVSEDQFRVFHKLLERAKKDLEDSWKLDSTHADAATHKITVAMGLNLPREEMETWFRRAMEADNDWYDAITHKMTYMQPKWHGSPDELVSFARSCFRTSNWEGRIATLPIEVHKTLARDQRSDYLRRPAVWADIREVFEEYLKKHPDARYARTYYALMAQECGDFAEARRQFDRLGDKYWLGLFRTRADAECRYDTIKIRVQCEGRGVTMKFPLGTFWPGLQLRRGAMAICGDVAASAFSRVSTVVETKPCTSSRAGFWAKTSTHSSRRRAGFTEGRRIEASSELFVTVTAYPWECITRRVARGDYAPLDCILWRA
jgi:hypothetical protein